MLAFAERGPDWAAFVDRLPRLVRELTEEWGLVVDGEPTHGYCSLVVPVRRGGRAGGAQARLPRRRERARGARRCSAGPATARSGCSSADPHRSALLLERLHPADLTRCRVLEACEVVAGLYARLHVPAPPQLRPLTSYVERWTAQLAALPRDAPVPHRLVQQAVSLGRDLVADDASTGVLIHADLHYENVLAGDREPWLVIDPKPVSGDPHYEPAPMLWNRWDEAVASGDVRDRRAPPVPHPGRRGRASTRTGPATGSWSGCCTTRSGSSRTTRDDARPRLPDHVHRDRQGGPGLTPTRPYCRRVG